MSSRSGKGEEMSKFERESCPWCGKFGWVAYLGKSDAGVKMYWCVWCGVTWHTQGSKLHKH